MVEVSDATLERDRTIKQQLYARAAVAIYWVVNLRDRRIEVYTEPSGAADVPGYGQRRELTAGEEIPLILDGAEIGRLAVSDLLP